MTTPPYLILLQKKQSLPQLFGTLPQKQITTQQKTHQFTQPKVAINCLIA